LWSFSIEGYFGLGGGLVVGENPDGSSFLTIKAGYGLGGGAQYDPNGKSPAYDCDSQYSDFASVGLFGNIGAAFGPVNGSLYAFGGYRVKDSQFSPYLDSSASLGASFDDKWGLRFGAAAGIEVSIVDYTPVIISER